MTETALTRLARFVSEDPLEADATTWAILRDGVIDILGCLHAGVNTDVAVFAAWRQVPSALAAISMGLESKCGNWAELIGSNPSPLSSE